MRRRRLGRTGLEVGEIGLGTVELGLDYGIPDGGHRRPRRSAAVAVVERALELGITLVDTARLYGESEAVLGRALAGRREEVVLITKCALPRDPESSAGAIRRAIEASLRASLRALRTDHVDVLLLHSAGETAIRRGRGAEALEAVRAAGAVRFVGASVYGEAAALVAIEDGRLDVLQVAFSALDRGVETRVLAAAQAGGVGIVARSVLLRGVLTGRASALPDGLAPLRVASARLADVAGGAEHLAALAYRYVLGAPQIGCALVGTARVAELEAAVAAAAAPPLDAVTMAAVRSVTLADPRLLDPTTWPAA